MTATPPLRLVLIAGIGRSGSTLLDRLLGQVSGIASMGEVSALWLQGFAQNRLCGCGEHFFDCPFWSAVTRDAFAADFDHEAARSLARHVDNWRNLPRYILSRPDAALGVNVKAYADLLSRLYERVRAESGAEVLIDSSKIPGHGFVLASDKRFDLHIVHLVRDPRAVAYSKQRLVRRSDVTEGDAFMKQEGAVRSALRWDFRNVAATLLGRRAASYTRVRYEDIVSKPRLTLQRILDPLGRGEDELAFLSGSDAEMRPVHLMAGNPSKFETGKVALRLDNEWERAMPRQDQLLIKALTLPLCLRYGY